MNIAIIGGGITGLTTALALHKLGYKSTVYERAETLNEIGAGIWLQPNAMKICDWLGIKEQIIDKGNKIDKMEIAYSNLQPIKEIKQDIVQDAFGNQTIAIHRGRLQSILYKTFEKVGDIDLGMDYQSHEIRNDGVTIHFGSKSVEADIVLGADGINSKVRNQILPESIQRNSGQICWRGISNFTLPKNLRNKGRECWGHRVRFGFSQIAPNEVYWFAVAMQHKYSESISKNELIAIFKDFDPLARDIIRNTDHWNTASLNDLKRLPTWHNNHTCLMGDAAHATTPNLGQGACQGIEDAYYFSNILSNSSSAQEAFESFESERRKKVDDVVNTSWSFGKMAHNPLGQSLLKFVMKTTPQSIMSKQMNKLYEVKAF